MCRSAYTRVWTAQIWYIPALHLLMHKPQLRMLLRTIQINWMWITGSVTLLLCTRSHHCDLIPVLLADDCTVPSSCDAYTGKAIQQAALLYHTGLLLQLHACLFLLWFLAKVCRARHTFHDLQGLLHASSIACSGEQLRCILSIQLCKYCWFLHTCHRAYLF